MTQVVANSNSGTRDRIVAVADQLFYEGGYEHTSFADIAAAVHLSRGNFYYHFKTKDQILDAVIELRMRKTKAMLNAWSTNAETPRERIACFIQMMVMNSNKIRKHGCPVGTLCTELAKLEHSALPRANLLFGLFREWLSSQFTLLGSGPEANQLAMHLLARSQGIATLANAFDDEAFIHQEVEQLQRWLHAIPNTSHSPKKETDMFVVLLKFSANRSRAGEWMDAHKAWLQRGFDDGVFVASGSLQGQQGGAILARSLDATSLQQRLSEDPFVAHDVVSVEMIDVALSKVDPRLEFLSGNLA